MAGNLQCEVMPSPIPAQLEDEKEKPNVFAILPPSSGEREPFHAPDTEGEVGSVQEKGKDWVMLSR